MVVSLRVTLSCESKQVEGDRRMEMIEISIKEKIEQLRMKFKYFKAFEFDYALLYCPH
jgi:hypothetical protein